MKEQLSLFGDVKVLDDSYQPQIDLKALYAFAKEQAKIHWDREFDIPIELVKRYWRRTNGMYIHDDEKGNYWIRMSLERNKHRSWEQVQKTLLHELVHWHMHTTNQPYKDRDIEFAKECLRVGAPFSGSAIAQKTGEIAEKLEGKFSKGS